MPQIVLSVKVEPARFCPNREIASFNLIMANIILYKLVVERDH